MSKDELYSKLMDDLTSLKIPVDEVEIIFRPYSKTYYGRFFIESKRVFIYPYEKEDKFYKYDTILCIAIHEMVHYIQREDPNFIRLKGVMHNPQFWEIYNHFIERAVRLNIVDKKELKKQNEKVPIYAC